MTTAPKISKTERYAKNETFATILRRIAKVPGSIVAVNFSTNIPARTKSKSPAYGPAQLSIGIAAVHLVGDKL